MSTIDWIKSRMSTEIMKKEIPFPPEILWWQWIILITLSVLTFLSVSYLFLQFIQPKDPNIALSYITLSILLISLIIERYIRHKLLVHKSRLVDQSIVEAIFVEAKTVEPRIYTPVKEEIVYPDNYDVKVKHLKFERERLENRGNRYWTEYQILSLNQMLVDFLSVDELIANVRLSLAELEEYADDSAYRYDRDKYYDRKNRIEDAIERINKAIKNTPNLNYDAIESIREEASHQLRAEFTALLEYVADYNQNWSTGSVLIHSLTVLGVFSIPILLLMGTLPILHPSCNWDHTLCVYHWGLLGISGAITAILLNLRKSNFVEVGNTDGRRELRNAILGSALGLVAGVLSYAMISGGLVETGTIIPDLKDPSIKHVGLSIVWAIASGYCFEKIFDRLRGATIGS